jgi:transcriptional regulator with XRE-family HTH domain
VRGVEPRSADHVAFGRAVRELREQRGLSQEQLALVSDMDRSYAGGVERGERNVSLSNILKLAAALDVPADELFARFEALRGSEDS